ncbi:MAG TPA: hypothetical protein VGU20_01165 [Stellaceae bacterium]|nr:hypothetical protein [Stellaceae bacterium]
MTSAYRPEFVDALKLLAGAFDEVVQAGFSRPVLVGGAAVEFYTGGAVVSGDFDVVTPAAQDELESALLRRGFVRPEGVGVLKRGLHHPTLGMGVEVVSGYLFNGASDESRVKLVTLEGALAVAFPPVEDLIADRMGQFGATGKDLEMLEQAVILYKIASYSLASVLDAAYLDRRIKQETLGVYSLEFLIEQADDRNDA